MLVSMRIQNGRHPKGFSVSPLGGFAVSRLLAWRQGGGTEEKDAVEVHYYLLMGNF